MSNEEPEWENIMNSWNSEDFENSGSARALPSDQVLKATVESAVKSGKIEAVVSVVMGLALGGYIVSEIVAGLPSVLDYILYYGMLTILTSAAFFVARLRSSSGRAEGEGTMHYLGTLLDQADTTLKVVKMGKLFCLAVFCLLYGIAIWTLVHMFLSGHAIAKPGMAALIMGFVTLFFPSMFYFLHKTQKSVVMGKRQLESMLESLR
jgi:hypothetical protein